MGKILKFEPDKTKRVKVVVEEELDPRDATPTEIVQSLKSLFTEEQLAAIRKDLSEDPTD